MTSPTLKQFHVTLIIKETHEMYLEAEDDNAAIAKAEALYEAFGLDEFNFEDRSYGPFLVAEVLS